MKKYFRVSIAIFLLTSIWSQLTLASVNFGVQAPRGTIKAMAKWGELGTYLSGQIGEEVTIVPLGPSVTADAVSDGRVDFVLSNPVIALVLREKQASTVMVTMNTSSGSQFAGVILTGKDSGVSTSKELIGKSVMAFKFKKSAAAYVFQVKHMNDQGISPHKDFGSFKEAKRQDEIVLAVKNGLVDGGFVKSGLLESMVNEGKLQWGDIVVLDEKTDSLNKKHSTVLYPNWTISAAQRADKALTQKLKTALLALSKEDAAAKKAKIVGFVEALPLDGLADTLKSLALPPYN